MRKKFFLLIIVCLVMGAVTDIEGNFTTLNVLSTVFLSVGWQNCRKMPLMDFFDKMRR